MPRHSLHVPAVRVYRQRVIELSWTVRERSLEMVPMKQIPLVKLLERRGAASCAALIALINAAKGGHESIVKALLEHDKDLGLSITSGSIVHLEFEIGFRVLSVRPQELKLHLKIQLLTTHHIPNLYVTRQFRIRIIQKQCFGAVFLLIIKFLVIYIIRDGGAKDFYREDATK
jgi:hypothetical protein